MVSEAEVRDALEEAHELIPLQIELVKLQRHLIESGGKLLAIFEGRDAAGKDGTIKRVIEHLSPRETRVVALGVPTAREQSTWYFQRWASHLPAASEFVLFNRSWYNRAGVERVMGFCSPDEHEEFMDSVAEFEHMLVRSHTHLFKYYLDVTKAEQAERLEDRKRDPLKQWKTGALDAVAQERWDDYSRARDEMLQRTHSQPAPWTIVRSDRKHRARVNVIRDLLSRVDYEDKDASLLNADNDIVFPYPGGKPDKGLLAP
jgi:polyphosphate kinase 2